jgi:Zn-dependent metalloprotease
MKKLCLLFILCSISITSIFAGELKNIWHNYECQNLTVPQVIDQCRQTYALPDNAELKLTRSKNDNIGMTHYTYQEYVDNVKVEGCYILVHTKNGLVTSVNGRLLGNQELPTNRTFAPRKQLRIDKVGEEYVELEPVIFEYQGSYRSAYKYYDESKYSNVYLDAMTGEEIYSESVVAYGDVQGTVSTIYNGTKPITCNQYNGTYNLYDNARNIYTVDATNYDGSNNNTLFDFTNNSTTWNKPVLTSVTIEWSAQDWWYNSLTDTKPDFYIQISSGGTILYKSGYFNDKDAPVTFAIPDFIVADGNLKIEVLDYDGISDDSAGKVSATRVSVGTSNWNNSKTRGSYTIANNPAHDVHWGMEKVYDFYLQKFNHRSYDGNGGLILNMVNPRSQDFINAGFPNNACAVGNTGRIAYGIGDKEISNAWVAIDVIGHEFTHMVTATNGSQNLPTKGEGGALNESFGDIMGNAVEAFALGTTDWVFMKGYKYSDPNEYNRSLKNPKSDTNPFARPSTYHGDYWKPITGNPISKPLDQGGNDNDWVHINCGVQDYWFYLLCQGGMGYIDDKQSNGSYSVTGIGMEKAVQIVYRNLLTYITSTSKYPDSRKGSIQAAIDLYGKGSQEHQSVVNAWYAVGVGDKYQEIVCKSVPYTESFAASQGDFSVMNLTLPSGFTSIWNWDAQYGMVAKCIKGSTKYESEAWLISPCIELPADKSCVVSFSHAAKFFQDTKQMSMWISANYDESAPEDAQWARLVIPTYPTGNNWNWFDSGEIDLSEYKGQNVNIAFCYKSNTNYAPQWEIKNFAVKLSNLMAVENVSIDQSSATKILRNGQIFILRGDKTYTLTGQEVN